MAERPDGIVGEVRTLRVRVADLEAALAEAKGLPTDGEICQSCGSAVTVIWAVKDKDWRELIGGPGGILCPRCFTDRAARRGEAFAFLAVPFTQGWSTEWYDLEAANERKDAALRAFEVDFGHFVGCQSTEPKPNGECDESCKLARAALSVTGEGWVSPEVLVAALYWWASDTGHDHVLERIEDLQPLDTHAWSQEDKDAVQAIRDALRGK